jgi:RHS repeat-associated protein
MAGDCSGRENSMKKHGLLNLVLVLSFLLPNLSSTAINNTSYIKQGISWNIKGSIEILLDSIDSWLDELMTDSSKTTQMNPLGIYPTATHTPGLGIPPTLAPTQTVAPTPSPTATEIITPTVTPALTPTVTPLPGPDTLPITMTFSTNSELVYPGSVISFTWRLSNWENIALMSPKLILTLPKGFELEGRQVLPLDRPDGSFKSYVFEDARGPFTISAEVIAADLPVLLIQRVFQEANRSVIGPDGGIAIGMNGNVQVKFPADALEGVTIDNPLIVRIRPPFSSNNVPYYLSNMPFEITAEQQGGGSDNPPVPVTHFKSPVEITVNYIDEQVAGMDEPFLFVYYFNEQVGDWEPIRSKVDAQSNILNAWVDHFSLFDVNAQNWEAARLPSLENFQVASFSGAATYSFPIQVPPGPGGLQPELRLSYSSLPVDSASGNTQASWAGMGWSLDTGYIQRNMHGTMTWLDDDTFSISNNGIGGMMLKGTDGYYHTTNESFWRIQYYPGGEPGTDYWVAWDKIGNEYFYGYEDSDRAHYPNLNPELCPDHAGDAVTWRWALSRIRNIYGKEIIYNYTKIGRWVKSDPCNIEDTYGVDVDIYPFEIIYPNWHYRVQFTVSTDRTDYQDDWENDDHTYIFYQKARLTNIYIQYDEDGDHDFNNAVNIRRYDLIYAQGSEVIFPNYEWTEGGKTLTLKEIKEYGYNGTGPLPSTVFTYGDGMHLTQAANGYGGTVVFTYEAWNEMKGPESQTLHQMTSQPYAAPCATTQGEPGYLNTGGWGGASCSYHNGNWFLLITGRSSKGIPPELFHPGGKYQLHATFTDTWDNIQLGLFDGQVDQMGTIHANQASITETFNLPVNAAQSSSYLLNCSEISAPTECYMHIFEAAWLPTFYRVTQKTVTDDVTPSSSSFNYSYDEPATNDATHSTAVATTDPEYRYTEAFSEFRGYAMTREVDPVGRVTTTFFDQGDARAGSANIGIVGTEEFRDDFSGSTLDTENWYIVPGSNPEIATLRGDTAVNLPGDSIFRTIRRQGYSIYGSKAVLLQFQSSGSINELNLGIESGLDSDYYSLGINVQADGSVHNLYCVDANCDTSRVLINPSDFHRDSWYVVLIILDDQGSYVRIWERDNPSVANSYKQNLVPSALWHSFFKTKNGSLWLDAYSEGQIFNLNMYLYDADSDAPIPAEYNAKPKTHDDYTYFELTIYWSRILQNISLDFEGDASYIGKNTVYEYNVNEQGGVNQYGNTTRIIEKYHNSGNDWVDYRLTQIKFYPNVDPQNEKYIVGLPGIKNLYPCPNGCSSFTEASILSSEWYIYDNNTTYSQMPTMGKTTGGRVLLTYAVGGNSDYADTTYGYDGWGNITSTTQYSGTTKDNYYSTGQGARTTYICYGGGGSLNGYACTDDGYHTYPAWSRNALDQLTTFIYEKAKGVLLSVTDPNNAVTNATYDNFGRLMTITRSGDNDPTMILSYHEASAPFINNPFWTEAKQLIYYNGNGYPIYSSAIRKYYNGIGQLLQTQVVSATIGTDPKDIMTDTFYNSVGLVDQQTVPYDGPNDGIYHPRSTTAARTTTTYDILGRVKYVMAMDSITHTDYTYIDGYDGDIPYLLITVTNPRGYTSATRMDIWGRVILVSPPTGPQVSYDYNEADRLVNVVRNNLTTHIDYDTGGRKKYMSDPDMGPWTYTYDGLGNLLTQTDPRTCRTTISYDLLNRPYNKVYSGTNCPATPSVTYTYDQLGVNGIGRRTGMSDGSGSTSWVYDSRGRLTQETKVITGSGRFKTTWGYNSADLVSWIRYPSDNNYGQSEYVYYTYLPQMVLDTVNGTNWYVYNTDYDASGRVTRRELGASPTIQSTYSYFDWETNNGLGRLQRIFTQKETNPALQDLQYTYDENGNVMSISDYVAIKPDLQIQNFTYDELDRLTSAEAIDFIYSDNPGGGSISDGSYSVQNYNYDSSSGNIQSMAGANYLYTNPYITVPPHGVQRITGGGSINNVTITIRAKGTKYLNVWPIMKLYVNGVYSTQWTVSSGSFTNYSAYNITLTGNDQIEVVYDNDLGSRQLEVDYVVVNGRTVQAEGGAALIDKGSGNAAYDWQTIIPGQQVMADNSALRFVVGERAFAGAYDQDGNMIARIVDGGAYILGYDAENRLVTVTGGVNASFTYDGDGNRVKSVVNTNLTTAFLGKYYEYELNGATTTQRFYYYAGSTRVAMRTGINPSTLYYLLGDHLGSTSITTDSIGVKLSESRYYAWGGVRYASGTMPTNFRYTGQRWEDYIKLIQVGSRWYDSSLGRFIQPDQIIPEAYNTLAYDRYQYAYSNPVRYTDSSGHCVDGVTTWVCILIIGGFVLKAVDYAWTAYDAYQSGRVLTDPNASREDKLLAGLNIGLAVIFEAAEPDELLPAGLPLDDAARKAVMKGAKEAFEEGGEEALEKFLRDNLGDSADDVLKKMDDVLGISNAAFPTQPSQLGHIFRDASGHFAEDTLANRNLIMDTISRGNFIMTDNYGNQVFARILDNGTEVWVYIRNGVIWDGGLNQVTRWIK